MILSLAGDLIIKKLQPHTTTLNAQELENRYGNRVRSRLKSMFNLISFDKNSVDKRKLKSPSLLRWAKIAMKKMSCLATTLIIYNIHYFRVNIPYCIDFF
jgi:hypothetical protein